MNPAFVVGLLYTAAAAFGGGVLFQKKKGRRTVTDARTHLEDASEFISMDMDLTREMMRKDAQLFEIQSDLKKVREKHMDKAYANPDKRVREVEREVESLEQELEGLRDHVFKGSNEQPSRETLRRKGRQSKRNGAPDSSEEEHSW